MFFSDEAQDTEREPVYLLTLADALDDAHRFNKTFDPISGMGSFGWIQISDELAISISERLRVIAGPRRKHGRVFGSKNKHG